MAHITKNDQEFLKKEFTQLTNPVKLINFTQQFECQYCQMTREILSEVAELSDQIILEVYDFVKDVDQVKRYQVNKIPATVVEGAKDYGIRFYGIPAGYEFSSLIEDIIDVSKGMTGLSESTKTELKKLTKPIHIQVFVTPTCPYCTAAVRVAHQMAIESDPVTGDMIEASEFPQLINKYNVAGVPKVVINETVEFEGALPEPHYLMKVLEAEGKAKVTK